MPTLLCTAWVRALSPLAFVPVLFAACSSNIAPYPPSAPACPPAYENQATYCQTFDAPSTRVGEWQIVGEPALPDAGAAAEDTKVFWSRPASRKLNERRAPIVASTRTRTAKRVEARFRFNPSTSSPAVADTVPVPLVAIASPEYAAYVAWVDYGTFDPSSAGKEGYALGLRKGKSGKLVPIPALSAKDRWDRVELVLEMTSSISTAKVLVADAEAASLDGEFLPTKDITVTLGPTDGERVLAGHVDDYSVVVVLEPER